MDRKPHRQVFGSSRRPASELIKSLASDSAALLKQEISLVRAELRENVKRFATHLGQMAVGGGVAVTGVLVLVAFAIIALGGLLGDEYWLAALIVAVALLGTGGLMILSGVRRLSRSKVTPGETIDSVRATGEWAKQEVEDFRASLSSGPGPATAETALAARGATAIAPRIEAVPLESRPGAESGEMTVEEASRGSAIKKKTSGKQRAPLAFPLYRRVIREAGADDVLGNGAKVAYFMFTSLPPALLVLFALGGIFGGERLGDYLAAQLQGVLPGSADDPNSAAAFVSQFIDQVVQTSAPGPLSIGLLFGIWAGSAVFVALTDALNTAYDVEDDRSWFKRRALAIAVMIGFILLFVVGSLVLLTGPQIAEALQLGGAADLAWTVLQWPLAFVLVVLAFFLVYYALPNRDQSRCKLALLKGSAIAAALWLLATFGFRIYIANFGSYGETYGFVGAVLVLLLWMYLTGIMILLGGEVASELERGAAA